MKAQYYLPIPTLSDSHQGEPLYDFSKLESVDEFKELVAEATVVFAIDISGGGGEGIAYGLETLRAITEGVIPPQQMVVVRFAIDFRSNDLERLAAALTVAKGFHEWKEVQT